MRRLLAFAVLVGLAWLIQRVPGGEAPAARATLVAGLVLLAGYVAGHLVVRLRLPRISIGGCNDPTRFVNRSILLGRRAKHEQRRADSYRDL